MQCRKLYIKYTGGVYKIRMKQGNHVVWELQLKLGVALT